MERALSRLTPPPPLPPGQYRPPCRAGSGARYGGSCLRSLVPSAATVATLNHLAAADGGSVDGAVAELLDLAARAQELRHFVGELRPLAVLLGLRGQVEGRLYVDAGHGMRAFCRPAQVSG